MEYKDLVGRDKKTASILLPFKSAWKNLQRMKGEVVKLATNMSGSTQAVVFINLFCIFDNLDNIFIKFSIQRGVRLIDATFVRMLFNFIAACFMVHRSGKHIIRDVPDNFKKVLTYRSAMILVDQTL